MTERTGRILRVKLGYNPNSSSLGSIVFAVPAAMLAVPVVFNAVAAAISAKCVRDTPRLHGDDDEHGDEGPR
jgi:hypothetical protein